MKRPAKCYQRTIGLTNLLNGSSALAIFFTTAGTAHKTTSSGRGDETVCELFRTYVNRKDKEYIAMIDRAEEITIYAKELTSKPINVQITNLGDSVNGEYPDFSPVLSADERTLIYTTRRLISLVVSKTEDGQYLRT